MIPDANAAFIHRGTLILFSKSACAVAGLLIFPCVVAAEPIVLTGNMVPSLLGKSVSALRVVNAAGVCIPFQIDEVEDNDYVCPSGKEPNAGNGVLDAADEIVFLWEDADTAKPRGNSLHGAAAVCLSHGHNTRWVRIVDSASIAKSTVSYITYDDSRELITTPYYYASFGHNRFHFTRAGVMDFVRNTYLNVTNELRVRIFLKALWGLLPIRYTQDNMVCFVKRYKAGPIRLIRRGDFHLNLGLFLQGSHAAVNQICYPQMVRVPVYVHVPVRFSRLFSEAYIEMTPMIRKEAADFSFDVPVRGLTFALGSGKEIDTLVDVNPNHTCMTVSNRFVGYGWLLDAAMDSAALSGSGYRITMPADGQAIAQCGFRLAVRDLPKGYYLIGNWVLFSKGGSGGLLDACERFGAPAGITVQGCGRWDNQLARVLAFRKH